MNIFYQLAKNNRFTSGRTMSCLGIDGWMSGLYFVLLMLALVMGCQSSRPNPEDSVAKFTAHLETRLPQLLGKYSVPGVSMALIRDGKLVWTGAYGFADIGERRKMTTDAVCRVESISKSVTAWGVMRLIEQGVVELDAPVQNYLHSWQMPQHEYPRQKITIRRLLSGNAGLALGSIGKAVEYPPQRPMPTLPDFLHQEVRFIREPGSGFMYSNVGFNLLELLIEEVSGRDFASYMAQEVLMPLDMRHASFAWDSSFQAAIPTGYEINGTAVPPYVYPAKASGGLFATAEDVGRFVCAEMTGRYFLDHGILRKESLYQMHRPQVAIPGLFGFVAEDYGFGHFIETLSDGRKAVWHGGQGHGWMTHFHAIPESGDGIVILTNSQRSWPFMAQVLTDWSHWLGIKPVKMGRIIYATKALWALIGFVLLILLWLIYRLAIGAFSGRRQFDPLSSESRGKRLTQFLIGSLGIAAIAWSAAQPYLFVSSIFPGVAGYAGISFLALSLLLMISSLFPKRFS